MPGKPSAGRQRWCSPKSSLDSSLPCVPGQLGGVSLGPSAVHPTHAAHGLNRRCLSSSAHTVAPSLSLTNASPPSAEPGTMRAPPKRASSEARRRVHCEALEGKTCLHALSKGEHGVELRQDLCVGLAERRLVGGELRA